MVGAGVDQRLDLFAACGGFCRVGRDEDLDLAGDLTRVSPDSGAVFIEDAALAFVLIDVPAGGPVPDVGVLSDQASECF